MEKTKAKACIAFWFSGFFGLGAFLHLVRLALGFNLVVDGREIDFETSALLAIVAGVLAIGLLIENKPRHRREDRTLCSHVPKGGNI